MQMNELGWIKKQFIEHNPEELREGYVFTIDGEPLEPRNFQPLGWYDIEFDALLKNSDDDIYECPSIACCTCGYVDCDSVRAIVEFKGDEVIWTLFILHEYRVLKSAKESQVGKYIFSKEQYLQAINSLKEAVEKDELIKRQGK